MIPNATKPVNREKCRAIYWAALTAMPAFYGNDPSGDETKAVLYLREFEQTRRCDAYTPFVWERIDLHSRVGGDAVDRALAFSESASDKKRICRTVWFYRQWYQGRLLQALPWQDRVYYHTVFRAGRWCR